MTSQVSDDGSGPQTWVRWRRFGLVAALLLCLGLVIYFARGALFPFIISIILAQLLYPVVAFMESRLPWHVQNPRLARITAIVVIYIVFAGVVTGILYLTIPPLFHEFQLFIETFPQLYELARSTVESWSTEFTERIPEELRTQFEEAVAAGGNVLADEAQGVLRRTVGGASNAVTLVIGLAIVPFLLFYLLKDREEIVGGVYPLLSPRAQRHTRNVLRLVNRVIGSYVRAQLLSAVIVGVLVFVGLTILGIHFSAILGLVAGLFGLIPIIGPLLGAVPGLLVTLASSPEQVVWVVLVYVSVQIVENYVISPRIHGMAVRLNPAFIVITLVVASEIAGLWGVIVGVPLVAAARDVFVYFYNEWDSDGETTDAVDGVATVSVGPEPETVIATPDAPEEST